MYLWADDNKFLRYIKREYANNIRLKRAHQRKLLMEASGSITDVPESWTKAIREAFIEQWGCTPAEALVILAQGGQIAGKNWSEGVYGIGALTDNFNGITIEDKLVKVDPQTGHIYWGNQDMTDQTVYGNVNGKAIATQLFWHCSKGDGMPDFTFMSQYHKLQKKYYAETYTREDGSSYAAKNGKEISAKDCSDIWAGIGICWNDVVDWILSLFGLNTSDREMISAENTLPNQTTDGFATSDSSMFEAGGLLLALAAGGALIAGGLGKKKNNSK